ncbi:MAG: HAD-IC family P-type ATPase [Akkermansiaceae bacterium]|nr:HAD-IC family P-type ATPase [Akkermansiaceae bacterium]
MIEENQSTISTKQWHAMGLKEVILLTGSNVDDGLSHEEASRRLSICGPNALVEKKPRSLTTIFMSQFVSPLTYLLVFAALIALILGERGDSMVILAVLVINAVIGAIQEGRAAHSMESLHQLATLKARVLRGGIESLVEARGLVQGDVLILAAGDAVAADARLIESLSLEASEATLTGESQPIAKIVEPIPADSPLAEQVNLVFSGTHITSGRGRAIVVTTGSKTEIGRIANLTESVRDSKTPLELRIRQLGHYLAGSAIGLFVVIIIFGVRRGLPFAEILMVAISQMVSIVPEGLPVAMTIALAIGMQRMAARRVIVRRLAAIETLGSTSVICTDKTGTLTRNEMTVTALWLADGRTFHVSGIGYIPEGQLKVEGDVCIAENDFGITQLLEALVLCNDAHLVPPDEADSRWRSLGDPTEAALLTLAHKAGIHPERLRGQFPRVAEIPFDSSIKMMATQHGHGEHARIYLKGAPEDLIALCSHVQINDQRILIDSEVRRAMESACAGFAARTLRLLAGAEVRGLDLSKGDGISRLQGMATFLGLVGETDPPREEVAAVVRECQRAGIRPVMVTGDHIATGLAIATLLGIAREGDLAIEGRELEQMTEEELRAKIEHVSVFARVHPAQKLRIVKAFQDLHHVVAMTGDGVNDAPALAAADVGVAMGITGTEVAKGAAKIIIADDQFATIVHAIEEGRLVYQNLKKVILFLVATSIDEVMILLIALFLGLPLPLAAVQILWINIVTEGALTINLVMEGPEGDEMSRRPIPRDEALITREMFWRMFCMVASAVIATLGFYGWQLSRGLPFELVRTETFTILAVSQWFNALNCQSATQSVFRLGLFKNRWLLSGLLLANVLHLAVIYTGPMNKIFHTQPIPLVDFFLIGVVASLVLWTEEARKLVVRVLARHREPHHAANQIPVV